MSEEQRIKEQCLQMAASEIEKLFTIIGDLGYVGYKISMCKLKGLSYNQCGAKLGVSRGKVQRYWRNCRLKGYDHDLRRIFNIPETV
jgi:hypothetical protein